MSYEPITLTAPDLRKTIKNSLIPKKGVNKLVPAQLLDTDSAQTISNYIVKEEGRLVKRKGQELLFTIRKLAYDAQTGNFTEGLTVTGTTSGATGLIIKDTDAGTTGTLILANVTGTFQDNEAITDTSTGAAVANGADLDNTDAITGTVKFTDDIVLFGFNTVVASYVISTGTVTSIKNDFSSNSGFSIVRFGDYAFVSNGVEKVFRISRTLAYNTQTANFTVGAKITGGTSGATAIILEDSDAGATGTLTLGSISGTFQASEIITDDNSSPGSATSNGVVTWTTTEVTDSPIASILFVFGTRLFAGNIKASPSKIQWAEQFTTTSSNPPFTNWSTASSPPAADDPSSLSFSNAGTFKSFASLGAQVIAFFEDGKTGVRIETIDIQGSGISQNTVVDFEREDFGGESGAIRTPFGVFYVNEAGLWQMLSGGNTAQPFSESEQNVSRVLGEDFVDDLDFTDADLIYDNKQELVLITCRQSASKNNLVIWYNPRLKAFGTFSGWLLETFLKIDNIFYATGSRGTKIWKLFEGNSDDGVDITTNFKQEIQLGALQNIFMLDKTYIQALLSSDSSITISYDVYDKLGSLTEGRKTATLTSGSSSSDAEGFGEVAWGDGFGASEDENKGLIQTYGSKRTRINEFTRIIVNIEEESELPHEIIWIGLGVTDRGINKFTANIT